MCVCVHTQVWIYMNVSQESVASIQNLHSISKGVILSLKWELGKEVIRSVAEAPLVQEARVSLIQEEYWECCWAKEGARTDLQKKGA